MKLYAYDHCPFCVRARMPLGLKGIDAEVVYLPNHDEETPIGMIGAKMLPILEDADGAMGESLDIVHKLDALAGARLFDGAPNAGLTAWLTRHNAAIDALVIPRTPDPVYPEFRDPAAVAYFTEKKEATFGAFETLLSQTDEKIAEVEAALDALVALLPGRSPSIDDILLFPVLRGLTIVPGLTMPAPVARYAQDMAERAGVPLVPALRQLA